MADRRGLNARSLARLGNNQGAPVFVERIAVTTSDSTVDGFGGEVPFAFQVLYAWGVMTAAGGAGDTAKVSRVREGTTADITDTADLSVFSDTDQFDFSQLDDANWDFRQGDILRVTSASSPALEVYVMCARL